MPTHASHSTSALPRSDARSNRLAILRATRDICAEHGDVFSVKQIAHAAEVSVATVYRHFDGKQALMDGVSLSRWQHLVDLATAPLHGVGRIVRILDAYSRMCTADSNFLHAMNLRPGFGELAERMRVQFDPAFEDRWRYAQAHRQIRPGARSVDVIDLTGSIQDPARRQQMLTLLLSGVTAPELEPETLLERLAQAGKRESEAHLFSLA